MVVETLADEHVGVVGAVVGQQHEVVRIAERRGRAVAGEAVEQTVEAVAGHPLEMHLPKFLDGSGIGHLCEMRPDAIRERHFRVSRWLSIASIASV